MITIARPTSLALALLLASTTAAAQEADGDRNVSVSLSTLNLLKPILSNESIRWTPELEFMGEYRVVDRFGAALVGTYGQARADVDGADEPLALHQLQLSAQGLGYPVGSFSKGMQLGVELGVLRLFGNTTAQGVQVQGVGNAFSAAGLIGYKVIAGSGFTFAGQIGGGPRFVAASAQGGGVATSERSTTAKILLNVNFGWSF